jgi:ADP-heptose:LPS heptosyltransferase/glycosyltransferase involved in cell wall biosynthesis
MRDTLPLNSATHAGALPMLSERNPSSLDAVDALPPRISLVVSTVNRTVELKRLMDSLLGQEFKDFEILVVDQNHDDRIVPVLDEYRSCLSITRIQTPARHGISSARNDGWRRVRGEVIVFPDDDCWYPPWFLRKGLERLDTTKAALVSGRFADESGRSINGRFANRVLLISRRSVWIAQAEAATFYRRDLLERLGGFDEELGIGSSSQWQAAEGPDFILRALNRGCACYFDPSLYGFHREYDLDDPTALMAKKGRMYGRGMGYVLRRHGYGVPGILHWASRPLITAFISMIRGRFHRAFYSLLVSVGRIEGWTGRMWAGMPADWANRRVREEISHTNSRTSKDHREVGSNASYGKKRREMTGPYRARNPLLVGPLYTLDALACLLPKRRKEIKEDRPLRVLVADWGHLGDVVTILPLLKFLESHPRVEKLGVLIGSWSQSVMKSSDIAARIHTIDHWALDRSTKSTFRKMVRYLAQRASLVHELNQCQYDISIDAFASFPSSHSITWGASIPRRVGFKSGGLGPCLTDPFNWIPDDRFMLEQQLKLLKPLLGECYPASLTASYPGFNSAAPESLLGVGGRPYIVIHMGPQNARAWLPEKWISLAIALKGQGYELVATGGPGGEMEAARALNEKVRIKDLTGRLTWEEFVATVAGATAVVTIDSVAGHVAACFGVPTIVLVAGRQRLTLWRPNNSNAIALTHSVACAPCHRTKGCAAMACIRLIDVNTVISSLQRVIKLKDNDRSKSQG